MKGKPRWVTFLIRYREVGSLRDAWGRRFFNLAMMVQGLHGFQDVVDQKGGADATFMIPSERSWRFRISSTIVLLAGCLSWTKVKIHCLEDAPIKVSDAMRRP